MQVSRYGAFSSDNRLESMNKKYKDGLSLEKVPPQLTFRFPCWPADARDPAGRGTAEWSSSAPRNASQPIAGDIRWPRRQKGKVL